MNFVRACSKCRDLGNNCLPCFFSIITLLVIRFVFKFEKWHALSPYSCHQYKRQCVEIIEKEVKPESVVEVGCGLGEIISRVSATKRLAIDIDPNVIKAARFLSRAETSLVYRVGSIIDAEEFGSSMDVLVMINWPHSLTPEVLLSELNKLFSKVTVDYLLVDEIIEKGNQRRQHDYEEMLRGKYEIHKRFSDVVRIRDLVLLRRVV